jgi:hypothetical protein
MLTRPPGNARQPIPGNTNRHLRMSPQSAALRSTAKSPVEVGTVLGMQNPGISGREEVEFAGWSQSQRYAQLGNSPEWRVLFPPTPGTRRVAPDSLRGVLRNDPQGSRGRTVVRPDRPHFFFSFSNEGRGSSPCLKAGVSAAKNLMIESQSEPTRRAKTGLDHRSPARVPSPPQGAARS